MLIITPEKSMIKMAKKWVGFKDFIIVDATDAPSSEIAEFGSRIALAQLSPPPRLTKFAVDPYSAESKIMARNKQKYLDQWTEDESFIGSFNMVLGKVVNHYLDIGEDLNVFVVFRNDIYAMYVDVVMDAVREKYDNPSIIIPLTRKMSKDEQKAILKTKHGKDEYKALAKRIRKIQKEMDALADDTEYYE